MEKVPFFTAQVASCRVATAYFPAHRKKAGDAVCEVAVRGGAGPAGVRHRYRHAAGSRIGRQHVDLPGAHEIHIGRFAAHRDGDPVQAVGSLPSTMALSQVSVVEERLLPWIVIHEFGHDAGLKARAIDHPLLEIVGAVPPAGAAESECRAGI